MEFVLVRGDMAWCRNDDRCPEWISAEGKIENDTPAKLRKFLGPLGDASLPVVVNSPGGNIRAALEMAWIMRKHKLSIGVGQTRWRTCPVANPTCAVYTPDGARKGEVYTGGAFCSSACTLFFAGGINRVCGQWAWLGVHQARSFDMSAHVEKVGLPADLRKMVIQTIGEMGVDKSLFDISLEAKPNQLRNVSQTEARSLNLTTELATVEDLVAARNCRDNEALATCATRARIPPRK
ncbi:hypothetical protein [Rhizobium lusitanum]|uniref:ATP-dependent Clp protease proteolytic subunit n=1 Tax=Rhizobium lusitanum TaxID=293958 RepID=A0A7X0INJ3_9HYPH|nr:hypothetical protein [Rhizobium lusitanum]MBB6484245.1 hypothetical protein [Rhizobium lusitanum]